jgi:hypothetical protein
VLPKGSLRLSRFEDSLRADLARATIAVHPVGAHYDAIVRIQLEKAAQDQRNGEFARLIWLPKDLQPADDNKTFLREIREKWAGRPFQVIEAPLQKFQTDLLDCLKGPICPLRAARKRPTVCVLCDGDNDRKAARPVRAWLHSQNLDVGSTTDRDQRRIADALLIYYGQCEDKWVRNSVAEFPPELLSRAVFLADPQTDDKDDFLIHDAQVIAGYSPAPLDESLAPFVAEIRSAWSRGHP